MCFSKRLEQLRKYRDIKQSDLARTIGCTQQTISSYENGKNKPSMDIICRLAEELSVTSDYLLYGNFLSDELSEEQKEILNLYEQIPRDKKKHATEILRTFI